MDGMGYDDVCPGCRFMLEKNPPVTEANKSLFSGFPTKNITILTVLGGGVKPR